MTKEDLKALLLRNPQISVDENKAGGLVSNPEPKRHKKTTLGGSIRREKESVGRPTVRFIGYRIRRTDPDNFAGSVKDLLDGLRQAGVIDDDRVQDIILQTEQEKVCSKAKERTEIEIIYDDPPSNL